MYKWVYKLGFSTYFLRIKGSHHEQQEPSLPVKSGYCQIWWLVSENIKSHLLFLLCVTHGCVLKAVTKNSDVPRWQLNVLRVVVCTQIQHSVNELDPLHFQDLEICLPGNKTNHISSVHTLPPLFNELAEINREWEASFFFFARRRDYKNVQTFCKEL